MYSGERMKTISISASAGQIKKIKELYKDEITDKKIPYADCFIATEDCAITVYLSGKVVLQGAMAQHHAEIIASFNGFFAHGGSDEVGTGDYFGPVCVCAVYLDHQHLDFVNSLNPSDTKGMDDGQIIAIAKALIKKVPYSLLILPNDKYNVYHKKYNLNAIKSMLHNQCYLHLQKKVTKPFTGIIDQFTPQESYFRYLKDEKEIFKDLRFETKAENKYLAVACGAIIARHAFLEALHQLEKYVGMPLPKGAGAKVDQAAADILEKHGIEMLSKVAKLHFKNTEKAKEILG
ncbi:MAG: ribonuclease HIII [Firmicutes bacterium HGW-Firmicutes-19]|nr:MAG: ribonuclease HIII [Firmicutes bacterium HGW-Firmicutes-19]